MNFITLFLYIHVSISIIFTQSPSHFAHSSPIGLLHPLPRKTPAPLLYNGHLVLGLDSAYERKYMVFVFLSLAYFT
jgi:hypothetical protein